MLGDARFFLVFNLFLHIIAIFASNIVTTFNSRKMRRFWVLSVFLFGFCALVAQNLSIGQYNIRYDNPSDRKKGNGWEERAPHIYSLLNYKSWDVIGAQEVLHHQLEGLSEHLEGYAYVGVGREDGKQQGEYAPIFYKKKRIRCLRNGCFWLSEHPDVVGSVGWDAALTRICTWGEFEDKQTKWRFWAFNLHMDHVGKVARMESARLVLRKIKEFCGDAPFVLTGDFNVDQNDSVYHLLAASGVLRDAHEVAKHRMCETGSMNYFKPNFKTDSRIDHIFVSSHFTVHRYALHPYNYWSEGKDNDSYQARMLSDHYPVDALVELPRLRVVNDWAQYRNYEKDNGQVADAKVVFMGNSITSNWYRFHPEFFQENKGYLCRGISGQVTAQMLARFRSDVINLHPETVVILAGTNDLAMNQGFVSIEHIFENIVSMVELARHNGINVVLCSLLPAERYGWSWEVKPEDVVKNIRALNDKIRRYAQENKIAYADYYSAMADEHCALKKEYQQDAVHPNKEGYLVMEHIIQKILQQ